MTYLPLYGEAPRALNAFLRPEFLIRPACGSIYSLLIFCELLTYLFSSSVNTQLDVFNLRYRDHVFVDILMQRLANGARVRTKVIFEESGA